jgi:hypothetical protein
MTATLYRRHNPYAIDVLYPEDRVFACPELYEGSNHGAFVNGPYAAFRFVRVPTAACAMSPPRVPPCAGADVASLFVGGIPANCGAEYLQALFAAVLGAAAAPVVILSFDLVPNQKRSQANSGAARITVSAADAAALLAAFAPHTALVDVGGAWVARTAAEREAMKHFVALRRTPGLGHINMLPMHCVTVEASRSQRRADGCVR